MAKTRLNESMRNALHGLARSKISCPEEKATENKAYGVAEKLILKMVNERYPTKDMKILQKYEVTRQDSCLRMQMTTGGVGEFTIKDESKYPLVPSGYCGGRLYAADEATSDALQKWTTARDAVRQATKEKLSDYRSLILFSRNLEDVEAIWPEATEIRQNLNRSLPVLLSDDIVARIKADVETRAGA